MRSPTPARVRPPVGLLAAAAAAGVVAACGLASRAASRGGARRLGSSRRVLRLARVRRDPSGGAPRRVAERVARLAACGDAHGRASGRVVCVLGRQRRRRTAPSRGISRLLAVAVMFLLAGRARVRGPRPQRTTGARSRPTSRSSPSALGVPRLPRAARPRRRRAARWSAARRSRSARRAVARELRGAGAVGAPRRATSAVRRDRAALAAATLLVGDATGRAARSAPGPRPDLPLALSACGARAGRARHARSRRRRRRAPRSRARPVVAAPMLTTAAVAAACVALGAGRDRPRSTSASTGAGARC